MSVIEGLCQTLSVRHVLRDEGPQQAEVAAFSPFLGLSICLFQELWLVVLVQPSVCSLCRSENPESYLSF